VSAINAASPARAKLRNPVVRPRDAASLILLRGEGKARGEWNIVCLAVNLKRFHQIRMA